MSIPDDLARRLSDTRPADTLSADDLEETTRAFAVLVKLAAAGQEKFVARRFTLVAAGDQLSARQRDLNIAAQDAANSSDLELARRVATDLGALHADLDAHLKSWEQLEKNQRDLASVLSAASVRSAELAAEVARRDDFRDKAY
jgi:hypothetical protein